MDLFEAEALPPQVAQRVEADPSGLADAALHREARMAVSNADKAVFTNLAGLLGKVIERELWRRYRFQDFASYALSGGTGLGVNTNARLWLLKCALDVQGRHLKQWAEVLLKVEEHVRVDARTQRIPVSSLRGNSLRTLATRHDFGDASICYLPTGQSGHGAGDGNLVRLRKSRPELFERVVAGEISLPEARRTAGCVRTRTVLEQIKRLLPKLTVAERAELRELLA
jgi:hypothetical protein